MIAFLKNCFKETCVKDSVATTLRAFASETYKRLKVLTNTKAKLNKAKMMTWNLSRSTNG